MEQPDILKFTAEGIVTHEYLLCLYGVVLWYVLIMALEKKSLMAKKKPFVFKTWRKNNGIDVLATICVAPLVVVFDDEIIDLYNGFAEKDIALGDMVYVMAGPIFNFLMRAITGFKKNS